MIFVRWCYPELQLSLSNPTSTQLTDSISIYEKGILCPLNEDVDEINETALRLMEGDRHTLLNADMIADYDDSGDNNVDGLAGVPTRNTDVPIEFLN